MTSALRSIFRMNLSIFALIFSITVTPFHALNLSCVEPSNPLIIQHLHPLSRIRARGYHDSRTLTQSQSCSTIHQSTMASHFTIHKRAISSHRHHLIHLTFHTCLFSSISLHLTCICHPYHRTTSSHISYFFNI